MLPQLLADLTLITHLLFIIFVILGALLVIKWRWLIWIHLPCAIWGALLEINYWICPLTHLENYFRRQANEAGYTGGFIEHYLIPIIYPPGLTPGLQLAIGIFVILINFVIYGFITWKYFQIRKYLREKHE